MSALYELDFCEWCAQQAAKLRSGASSDLDWSHLAEEIEELGKQWRRELRSRFKILFLHLLKWEHSTSDVREWHKNSWLNSIRCQRMMIPDFIEENPSLKHTLAEDIHEAYETARREASYEGNMVLEDIPADCPYALEDALKEGWLPRPRFG